MEANKNQIRDALAKEETYVLAPLGRGIELEAVCKGFFGDKPEQMKAIVVEMMESPHLRKDSVIVVPCTPKNGSGTALSLHGIVQCSRHWRAGTSHRDLGGIVASTFFQEVGVDALPLAVKRRADEPNNYFTLSDA